MRKFILAMAGVALSTSAFAQDPAWTFADFGFTQGEEFGDEDSDAYDITGSFGFADKYHIGGSYWDGEAFGEDFDGYEIVAGINPALTDNTDFVFQAFYTDLSLDDSDDDVDGYGARIGIRSMYTDNVELFGNVEWADLDADGEDATTISVNAGGQYFFTDNISVNLEAGIGSELFGDTARFGIRYSFDQ